MIYFMITSRPTLGIHYINLLELLKILAISFGFFQDAINAYNTNLLQTAVSELESAWGTKRLLIPSNMQAPYMRLIRVPDMPNYEKSWESYTEDYLSIVSIQIKVN